MPSYLTPQNKEVIRGTFLTGFFQRFSELLKYQNVITVISFTLTQLVLRQPRETVAPPPFRIWGSGHPGLEAGAWPAPQASGCTLTDRLILSRKQKPNVETGLSDLLSDFWVNFRVLGWRVGSFHFVL